MNKEKNQKIKENEKKEEKQEIKISTIVYSLLMLVFVFIVFLGILIYGFKKEYTFVKKFEKIIPFPAAIVQKSKLISIGELNENIISVKRFYESQDFSKIEMRIDFSTESGKKRLKMKEREVLNKMIENKAIEYLAQKRGIKITEEMVDYNLSRKIEEYGNEDKLKSNLKNLYGWTIGDFKNKIVKPDLYKEELEKKFLLEDTLFNESKKQIEEAKQELEKRKSFAEVAKSHSMGSTAEIGGEIGWITKDQMIKDISSYVFSMEKGKRSDILESSLGFHIVEIEDKKIENDKELIKIRQIFTPKKIFAEFLSEEMSKMKIIIFTKDYYWDKESLRVEFKNQEMKEFEKNIIESYQQDFSKIF